MNDSLYFHWSISTLFGWGVYGLNLLRYWQEVSGTPAYSIGQIDLESLRGMDPLTLRVLAQPLVDSDQMRIRLSEAGNSKPLDGLVLHSLGNRFAGPPLPRDGGVTGRRTCGIIFFEDTNLPDAVDICGDYDLIVTGSSWCEEVLRARGVRNVATVLQGIDPSLFHPAPRADLLAGRFVVFSGGKIEHRKAQDLVVLAFRAFASRHPEAILVTAWHSPWSAPALTVNRNPLIAPVTLAEDGRVDMYGWAAANGIGASQFFDLGPTPNHLMARMLREMDVALFPNRCEGGTNLVAMECMACGVPTILSDNTGHKDLTATKAPYILDGQGAVISDGIGTDGWGESDVEEIVESLETVWANREEARRRGLAGAEAMAKLNWRHQIGQLHDTLAPLCT
jgi:glycosyltransferase involved in cell wall biosynthesis